MVILRAYSGRKYHISSTADRSSVRLGTSKLVKSIQGDHFSKSTEEVGPLIKSENFIGKNND